MNSLMDSLSAPSEMFEGMDRPERVTRWNRNAMLSM
jgi:hypothetical protein